MPRKLWTATYGGQVFTRSSQDRIYSHVIVYEYTTGELRPIAWAGSDDLAQIRANGLRADLAAENAARAELDLPTVVNIHIVPCTLEPRTSLPPIRRAGE